jgi:hypothetical protein
MRSNHISGKLRKRLSYCHSRNGCRSSKRASIHRIRQLLAKFLEEEFADWR